MSLLVEVHAAKTASKKAMQNTVSEVKDLNDYLGEKDSSSGVSSLMRDSSTKLALEKHEKDPQPLFQTVVLEDGTLDLRPAPPEMSGGAVLFDRPSSSTESGGDIIHGTLSAYIFHIEKREAVLRGTTTVDIGRVRNFGAPLRKLENQVNSEHWPNLTRSLDASSPAVTREDPKVRTKDPRPRIYIPPGAREQYKYYSNVAKNQPQLRLEVMMLPAGPLTPEFLRDINDKPGVLALAMEATVDEKGNQTMRPLPFIVPGGRFNEMYGWDTYFQILGLLTSGNVEICEAMVRNFCFCVQHYGKMLNAVRSYYLGRSQPPFLTSMGLAVHEKMERGSRKALELIKLAVLAAMKEYHTVWMSPIRYDNETGLSRYQGEGVGFPPEVEPSHYDEVTAVYAAKHNVPPGDFAKGYTSGEIKDAELDEYLRHDRASRESGHDTTYRFIDRGADLATVDLNSCLYKYEVDIAHILDTYFGGEIQVPAEWQVSDTQKIERASSWKERSANRQLAMNKYLWCQTEGTFYDYDTKERVTVPYESASMLWPLWAGVASPAHAESMVQQFIPKLECHGGLVSSSEKSRGAISPSRPLRQWDYPYGWAPHQMLAWDGLKKYGYRADAERLAYQWLSMIIKTYTENNGVVVEKYDVTKQSENHVAEAEYGNQGSDFDSKVLTGFGWTNASFVYGVAMLQSAADAEFHSLVGEAQAGILGSS